MKGCDEFTKVDSQCPTECPELNHVNTALAAFTLADKRLALTDALGKLHLRKARPFASVTKMFKEISVFPRRN